MRAPKQIINDIKKGNIKKVREWLIEASMGDCDNAENIRIENQAAGEYQGEGEYCLQSTLLSEAGTYVFIGTYYHEIEDSNKFIVYDYYISA